MKIIYLFTITFLMGSCSSLNLNNNIAPGYVDAYQSISKAIFGYDSVSIPKEVINNIPYASIKMKIGKGPEGLLILESLKDQKQVWISADDVYFVILNGRIIATKGLENNLTSLVIPKEVTKLNNINETIIYKHYSSYDNPAIYNMEKVVEYKKLGKKEVSLLNGKMTLNLIEEVTLNKYLGWEVSNLYWMDDEGFIWKSEQNISPKLPTVYIEVTKKPSV
tara:strand:- start:455 stop:1117 length:663 start_codon:yes stop_codon:yes gene_type:complete